MINLIKLIYQKLLKIQSYLTFLEIKKLIRIPILVNFMRLRSKVEIIAMITLKTQLKRIITTATIIIITREMNAWTVRLLRLTPKKVGLKRLDRSKVKLLDQISRKKISMLEFRLPKYLEIHRISLSKPG